MKLFISWSGKKSHQLAGVFRDWLPEVIQILEPWMSAEDIDKGKRWSSDIASQLNDSQFGIICLTRENQNSSWILFEAGALSKALDKSFVCPYLLDIEPLDLTGPLVQFQATRSTKEDTKKLLFTINKALGGKSLNSTRVESAFERCWPDFEQKLSEISNSEEETKDVQRSDRHLLEEVLELTRSIERELKYRKYTNNDKNLLIEIQKSWIEIVAEVRKEKIALASFLSDGYPKYLINNRLILVFDKKFGFHKDHVYKSRKIIEKILQEIFGVNIEVECSNE